MIATIAKMTDTESGERYLQVTMDRGNVITISPCYESWEQYGGDLEQLKETAVIAEQYNNWLHKGNYGKIL